MFLWAEAIQTLIKTSHTVELTSNVDSKKGNLDSDLLNMQEQIFCRTENAAALERHLKQIRVNWKEAFNIIYVSL